MEHTKPTLTDQQADEMLKNRPSAVRVTREHVIGRIKRANYMQPAGTTLTICMLTMWNDLTVTGQSACIDPLNFDRALGEKLAYENAVQQAIPMEAYLMASANHALDQAAYSADTSVNSPFASSQDNCVTMHMRLVGAWIGPPDFDEVPGTVDDQQPHAWLVSIDDPEAQVDHEVHLAKTRRQIDELCDQIRHDDPRVRVGFQMLRPEDLERIESGQDPLVPASAIK